MTEKNPYENQETVDIPSFSSSNDDEIDQSIFKMEDEEFDEDDYEDEPAYRQVKRPVIIVTIVLIAVLLGLSIFGLVSAASKKKAYNQLKEEYDAYVTRAAANESSLNAQIANLQAQLAQTSVTPIDGSGDKGGSVIYKIAVDNGLSVRKGPSTSESYADYSKLPDDVRELCDDNGESGVFITNGAKVKVLETKTDSTMIWGRIAENAWICLKNGSEDYCVKQ